MASIDRTAYPRFKRTISVRELREAYSPSLDELEWARQTTDSDEAPLSLTMCLKCCQRLGYFARFDEVPASIVDHLRQELGLHESVNPATLPDKTVRNHRGLVRHRLGLVSDQATARKIADGAIRTAAEAKDNPADLINIALEELVKSNCESPGYTTLDRMAGQIRTEVNTRMHELVHGRMTEDERRRILALLRVDPLGRRSGHDQLKDVAPKATVSRLRRHLDHLAWLDGIGSATATWLKDIPAAKIDRFAGEASALDASEMGDFAVVKRIVLEVCLLHRARQRQGGQQVRPPCLPGGDSGKPGHPGDPPAARGVSTRRHEAHLPGNPPVHARGAGTGDHRLRLREVRLESKYVVFIGSDGLPVPEALAVMQRELPAWIEQMDGRGVRLLGRELDLPQTAVTVRVRGGETLVTDGPFAETKEFVAGLDIFECANLEEAIQAAATSPVSWYHPMGIPPFARACGWRRRRLRRRGGGLGGHPVPADHVDGRNARGATGRRGGDEEGEGWRQDLEGTRPQVLGNALQGPVRPPRTASVTADAISDGPFIETKEFIAGIDVVRCADGSRRSSSRSPSDRPVHAIELRRFYSE